jgi:hypothetical protein
MGTVMPLQGMDDQTFMPALHALLDFFRLLPANAVPSAAAPDAEGCRIFSSLHCSLI